MKRTILYFVMAFFLFFPNYYAQDDGVLELRDDEIALVSWDLFFIQCEELIEVLCCCDLESGQGSIICEVPSFRFGCRVGGPFECTRDLNECEPNVETHNDDGDIIWEGCGNPNFNCCIKTCA